MIFGVGKDPVSQVTVQKVFLLPENITRLQSGEHIRLEFRNGIDIPVDLILECYPNKAAAIASLESIPDAPGCVHDCESRQALDPHPSFLLSVEVNVCGNPERA